MELTYPNGSYGTEIDLTGTYKITDNLSYMLGVGYLFTGDYFKGYDWPGQTIKLLTTTYSSTNWFLLSKSKSFVV